MIVEHLSNLFTTNMRAAKNKSCGSEQLMETIIELKSKNKSRGSKHKVPIGRLWHLMCDIYTNPIQMSTPLFIATR